MNQVVETVWKLAEPVVQKAGCSLWDVEYVKEGGAWFLRVYIDKDGAVSIDDCERVSRALDGLLDEADPIPGPYTFEVSSAGAERVLKRPSDFARFLGHLVEVRLYRSADGRKEWLGTLEGFEDGAVTIAAGAETRRFESREIAMVRLRIG